MKLLAIIGKVIGSIVCGLLFGFIGLCAGVYFPWADRRADGYASIKVSRN